MTPIVIGLAGEVLDPDERALIRDVDPAGFILFGRNCRTRAQVRALTDSLRSACGHDRLAILTDQEGGRVGRLGPPEWPAFPAGAAFAALYQRAPISAIEAARVNALAIASLLREVGINVDCLPLLDVVQDDTHDVIGDRALGSEPMQVAALGKAVLDGLAAGGVAGVIKHVPGHGRAASDSHVELPVVDADEEALALDLAPFRALRDAPIAMTAHVLYPTWDAGRCATVSPIVIEEIVRGVIGFQGLLLSDDLTMEALDGSMPERAAAALGAGCDLGLIGSGRLEDARSAAEAVGEIAAESRTRLDAALSVAAAEPEPVDIAALTEKRDALLGYA